jgi:hypothetical protein
MECLTPRECRVDINGNNGLHGDDEGNRIASEINCADQEPALGSVVIDQRVINS